MDEPGRAKRCGDCGLQKPLEDFAWRRKHRDQHDSLCRPCRAAYHQRHYAANRQPPAPGRCSDKLFDVGASLPYRSWQSILDEIAKCEVVCANCHRRRTARRRGNLRMTLTETAAQLGAGDENRTRS